MTKKDYELIAESFRRARSIVGEEDEEQNGITIAIVTLASDLKEKNERFDFAKFIEACKT